ncbi:hypothetical protein AX769_14930 [Frondihabitans sp. PAMC 28766]|nr:hypothetical protein AX769_14930 [Frondihabitans sp. PAMC 28766]
MKVTDVVVTTSVVAGGGALFVLLGVFNWAYAASRWQGVLGSVSFVVGVLLFLFAFFYGVPKIIGLARDQPRHLVVEQRFAAANDFDFFLSRFHAKPSFMGILFRLGVDRVSFEVMKSNRLPFVEWGNYRYSFVHNRGRNRTPIGWGYLRVPMAKRAPDALFCLSQVKQMRRLTRFELPQSREPLGAFDVFCEAADRPAATAVLDADTLELLRLHKFSFEFADGYFSAYKAGLFRLWKPDTVLLLADVVSRIEGSHRADN